MTGMRCSPGDAAVAPGEIEVSMLKIGSTITILGQMACAWTNQSLLVVCSWYESIL